MRYVKWIFVVLLISSLTSFMNKDKTTGDLNVGDIAPDFAIQTQSDVPYRKSLSDLKGKRVLISFWASYDAPSRIRNTALNRVWLNIAHKNMEMVSVSFDEYESIFKETIRKDQITASTCFVETKGESSELYETYQLNKGFTTYLLDEQGIIVAKNISANELSAYLK